MKFSFLKQIVSDYAEELKLSAAYSGSHGDGGSSNLLSKLNDYRDKLVAELDLRPSEFSRLNDIEVGEPMEFSKIIEEYKIKLSKDIKL